MIEEIIRVLSALKDTNEVSSEQILLWAQIVKAQRAQKKVLDNMEDARV